MMPATVTVSGDFNIEIFVKAPRFPLPNETVRAEDTELFCTGEGYSLSCALARLGADVRSIGCIGNDIYGKIILSSLGTNKVKTDYITAKSGSTGTYIKLKSGNEVSNIAFKGVNSLKDSAFFKNSFKNIRGSDYFVFGTEEDFEAVKEIINFCFDNGVKIIYNVSSFKGMSAKALKMCNYLIIDTEAAENFLNVKILNEADMENAVKALKKHTNAVIILFNENLGAIITKDFENEFISCYKQNEDNYKNAFIPFSAGFITALLKKAELFDCADFGLFAVSATKVKGAVPLLRSLKDGEFKKLIYR